MEKIFFALPNNEVLTQSLVEKCFAELGKVMIRQFPDGETYIRIESDVQHKQVFLVCTLDYPDAKIVPLYYLAQTAKELGAQSVHLIAPYLAYMRQDKRFERGEGITSAYFAKLLSLFLDSILTLDPHLHRRNTISEIYSIPTTTLHTDALVSKWIFENVDQPILIGPDAESTQWVTEVAHFNNLPFLILEKTRRGDENVEITVPNVDKYIAHTPVLVDDIISTASTMITTIGHLKKVGMRKPVCIGIHGIFADNAYANLSAAGAEAIITCNTIPHQSNIINIDDLIASAVKRI